MLQRRQNTGFIAGVALPMVVACLFAVVSLALAVMGLRVLQRVQADTDNAYACSVAGSYLRTKLLYENSTDAVSLREEETGQVLVIVSSMDGRMYETRIFFHEGNLRESFVTQGTPFSPQGGEVVVKLAACHFSLGEGGLFTADMESARGDRMTMALALAVTAVPSLPAALTAGGRYAKKV